MLVPPLHRRHEHTHAAPFDSLLVVILTLFPEKRITGTREHNDVRPGAMTVGLLVFTDGEL
jgi:hypothetical protein